MSENIEKAEVKDEVKVASVAKTKVAKSDGRDAKKPAKTKKPKKNPIAGMISELKKVTWPTKQDLRTYTVCVVVFVVLCAVLLGIMDLGIGKLIGYVSNTDQLPTVIGELLQ